MVSLPERSEGSQRSSEPLRGPCWAGQWSLALQSWKWRRLDLLRVGESHCFREEPGPIPLFFATIDSPSKVVPGLLAQLMVAMESGCHPTPLLLSRHLVARHHLLGHLGSPRACLGLSEGAQWTLEPGDLYSWAERPEQPCSLGLGCPRLQLGTNEAQESEGKAHWWTGRCPLHCPGENEAVLTLQH